MAFFDRLGAVGYTRAPVLLLEPPAPGAQQINRLRNQIRKAVQARIPGEAGAVSAALMTGDRAGISQSTTEALRASNLSHLLAISGLHMGLLAGPRALSAERRSGFAAGQWLENDGDMSDQAQAVLRFGAEGSDSNRPFLLCGLEGVILRGKEAEAQANALCDRVELVIVSAYLEDPPRGGCHLIDRTLLDKTGALAVRKQGGDLVVESTQRAQRLWSPKEPVAPWVLPKPRAATLLSQREGQ